MSRWALITGASGGIGQAAAKKLAHEGCHVMLHYHKNEQAAVQLAAQLEETSHIQTHVVQADLAKMGGADELVSRLPVPPDILVLNSGKSHVGLVTDTEKDVLASMVQLHVTSPYELTQHLLPAMIQKKAGHIVVVSSIWGETGASCEVLYSMVKGAQNAFIKGLAKELAPSGIRANAVSPGAVRTDMMKSFTQEDIAMLEEEIPLGRLASPEEIANVIWFLASKQSSYMTGQILSVNGGWYC
ncbi:MULTISPECIES: elongation factor P 5-aminopentanone reductase [Bacillus]|uniref:elongation factor P 5-aminopentanone reductase n=1 Tax=Bacillus TaxID=1386 RepID=UPI000D03D76C|nr:MULTISPECIES: SDR family oxidoreductase [Bacillus]AZV52400.1 SDR family NAD(P)-dependent oxidoreductase [Bacillus pumilus]MBU5260042.1 SDR family oxidoreductase [Bacillus pumilus]PRS70252.1 short chain dehydrogenase [Bacillus sp. NMTD17]PSB71066.1 short chain dehydrogenase [Bacillus sp. LNXM12-1]PSB74955.1 short chain dehydrogenase [Bacillus sp. LNXM12-2]